MKRKRILKFKKQRFNEDEFLNYKTISDAYIVSKVKQIADATNCQLLSVRDHPFWTDGKCIATRATIEDYMSFCAQFCEALGSYIREISF